MAKILVADDQESMLNIISGMLKGREHTVKTVSDGAQALAAFQSDPSFDLIVADVNMPRLNGFEFLKRIKELDPQKRVILISGILEDIVKAGVESSDLAGFIKKPFLESEALEVIDKALENPHS